MSISILPHANDNDSANDDADDADYVNDYYKEMMKMANGLDDAQHT